MNKICYYIASFFCACFLSSCNDAKLAEEIEGNWHYEYTAQSEDGSKVKIDMVYEFDHVDSNSKNGGNFAERQFGAVQNVELEDINGTVSYKYDSYIEGTWEVKEGDLQINYDLNSLEVEIDADDVKLKLRNALSEMALGLYVMGSMRDPIKDFVKEAKKELYGDLYEEYKHDRSKEYRELKIEGNSMSFLTDDEGRVQFNRIITNVEKETNNEQSNTPDDTSQDEVTKLLTEKIKLWDNGHLSNQENTLRSLYANKVLYYGQNCDIEKIIKIVQDLIMKDGGFVQDSHDLKFTKLSENIIRCNFTKSVKLKNKLRDYPSYLFFSKIDGDWYITEESDDITDRNLQKRR